MNEEQKEERQNGVELKYNCGYCGYVFKRKVRSVGNNKKSTGSDQVVCSVCGNFLKTFEGV